MAPKPIATTPPRVAWPRWPDWPADDVVFLAGSTQEPEESVALEVFQQLSRDWPQLRLIIVPRHPERFDCVARMLDASGVAWQRRTLLEAGSRELGAGSSEQGAGSGELGAGSSEQAGHPQRVGERGTETIEN